MKQQNGHSIVRDPVGRVRAACKSLETLKSRDPALKSWVTALGLQLALAEDSIQSEEKWPQVHQLLDAIWAKLDFIWQRIVHTPILHDYALLNESKNDEVMGVVASIDELMQTVWMLINNSEFVEAESVLSKIQSLIDEGFVLKRKGFARMIARRLSFHCTGELEPDEVWDVMVTLRSFGLRVDRAWTDFTEIQWEALLNTDAVPVEICHAKMAALVQKYPQFVGM